MTVAALFVDPAGVYAGLPGVEVWDEARDARLYAGPWPVVAHPPCNRWVSYGALAKRGEAQPRSSLRRRGCPAVGRRLGAPREVAGVARVRAAGPSPRRMGEAVRGSRMGLSGRPAPVLHKRLAARGRVRVEPRHLPSREPVRHRPSALYVGDDPDGAEQDAAGFSRRAARDGPLGRTGGRVTFPGSGAAAGVAAGMGGVDRSVRPAAPGDDE